MAMDTYHVEYWTKDGTRVGRYLHTVHRMLFAMQNKCQILISLRHILTIYLQINILHII